MKQKNVCLKLKEKERSKTSLSNAIANKIIQVCWQVVCDITNYILPSKTVIKIDKP